MQQTYGTACGAYLKMPHNQLLYRFPKDFFYRPQQNENARLVSYSNSNYKPNKSLTRCLRHKRYRKSAENTNIKSRNCSIQDLSLVVTGFYCVTTLQYI